MKGLYEGDALDEEQTYILMSILFNHMEKVSNFKKSTKKFTKEGTESNPRFKCMEGNNEYSDDIREFRDDVISALKKCYGDEYMVEPDMVDGKSILVSDPYAGLDYKIDISVSDEVDM